MVNLRFKGFLLCFVFFLFAAFSVSYGGVIGEHDLIAVCVDGKGEVFTTQIAAGSDESPGLQFRKLQIVDKGLSKFLGTVPLDSFKVKHSDTADLSIVEIKNQRADFSKVAPSDAVIFRHDSRFFNVGKHLAYFSFRHTQAEAAYCGRII